MAWNAVITRSLACRRRMLRIAHEMQAASHAGYPALKGTTGAPGLRFTCRQFEEAGGEAASAPAAVQHLPVLLAVGQL